MEKECEFHLPFYACFIDVKKAYDSIHHNSLWCILKHTYHLPEKLLTIIRALHEDCTAAVRAYQGCVLAPTLFNFNFDASIHMALDVHRREEIGIKVAYVLDAYIVGNRRSLKLETLLTDLEYADDMALLADNRVGLTTMMDSVATTCKKLGLTISCKKIRTLAVLTKPGAQSPAPVQLVPGS